MSYTVYAVEHVPAILLSKYPNPALYAEGKLYLFGESLKDVSGIEPTEVVDIESMTLTNDELDTYVDHLLTVLGPAEVRLSKAQGQYLYHTRFKPVNKETT